MEENSSKSNPPFYAYVHPSLDLNPSIIAKAKGGDSFSQLDIGKSYYSATNITDKLKNAFDWLMLAAQQRNMEAQFRLGDMYALGEGVEKNEFTAYDWYLKSALQGYPKALTRIHNLYHIEKSMYSRGQLNSGEEDWAQDDFKKKNNIRELYECRIQQMGSQLTKIKEYFLKLAATCRNIDDQDESDQQQQSDLILGFLFQHGYGVKKFINRAIELYQLAAEKGNSDAQCNLGLLCQQSTDIKWKYREAFKWFTLAAENGSVGAQENIAFLYLKGLGTDIDYSKALYWYTKAAESRNVKAQISLACIYRNGMVVDQDYETAIYWYKQAIKEGSTVAQNCLEQLYNVEIFPNEIFSQSMKRLPPRGYSKKGLCSRLRADISKMAQALDLKKLKKRARCAFKGDGAAMLEFGLKYYHGNQFTQDKDVAFRWIRNAAKAGSTEAQLLIAKIYKDGDGVEQNYHTTGVWYAKAAKNKSNQAQHNLGMMYYEGLGVRKDYLEASKWFTFAADSNNCNAQLQLGILRKDGRGLRQDLFEAIYLFTALVKQKNPEAIYQLARIYESSTGVKLNTELALYLLEKAAQFGNLDSQIRLGNIYSNTNNSMYNVNKSIIYYEMAANQGDPHAKYQLAILHLEGKVNSQSFLQAYYLFKEASDLGDTNAANIFSTPIDYSKNKDIDYCKLILMFEFVCDRSIASLEYNLARLYKESFTYIYNNFTYTITSNNLSAKTFYEKAAEKNIPEAQYDLGIMYEKGEGVAVDLSKTVQYYTSAHKNGYANATYKLACMHLEGYGVSQNLQKAFLLYNEASDKGHEEAHTILHLSVENLQQEKFRSARKIITAMAELGNTISQYQLGCSMLSHQLPQCCTADSIHWLTLASQGGLIDASYLLGLLYNKGELVEQDYEKAIQYFRIAADKGNEVALYELAKLYHFGKGTRKNYVKAFELYVLAAKEGSYLAQHAIQVKDKTLWGSDKNQLNVSTRSKQLDYYTYLQMWEYVATKGNPNLQFDLGNMYEGEGECSNLTLAVKWYSEAAKHSHSKAIYRLGRLYELGLGIDQDYAKAIELYKTSGNQNNEDALYRLGTMCLGGEHVQKDPQKAIGYFERAKKNGNSDATFMLAKIFEEGIVTPRDTLKAVQYYNILASEGIDNAVYYLCNHYDEAFSAGIFYSRKLQIFRRIEELNRRPSLEEKPFLEYVNYTLGHMHYYGYGESISYPRAWRYFNQAKELNESSKAANYLTIKYENVNISAKDGYLKKLEMFEAVVRQLKHEYVYELGLIYYHGVFEVSNDVEFDEFRQTIIKQNHKIASQYFEMITAEKPPENEIDKHYSIASYYLGMVNYIETILGNDNSKSYYYFYNASNKEYPDGTVLLESLQSTCRSKLPAYKKVFEWHIANQKLKNVNIIYNIAWMFSKGFGTKIDLKRSFYYYKLAADKNHSDAQFQLGLIYEYGYGIIKNYNQAIQWYRRAAASNHIGATFSLAQVHFYGIGVDRDYSSALSYYEIAANLGYNKAQYQLGLLYSHGYGTERNYQKALEWYTRAAHHDQAEPKFNFTIGQAYFNGEIVNRDYNKASYYYRLAAIRGHSDAQFQLGFLYSQGLGTEKNINDAILWYTRAANQGHVEASFNLGQMHFYGIDIAQNFKIAYGYYLTPADKEHSEAQFQLGCIYEYGYGVEIDYNRAIEWYTKASNQNHVVAIYNLGRIYFCGTHVKTNYKMALHYYNIAACEGHSDSQSQIAFLYFEGLGVEKNPKKCIMWYTRAASQNHVDSNFRLGEIYFNGEITSRDYRKAFEYYKSAANQGHNDSQFQVVYLYSEGLGVKRDIVKATWWYSVFTNQTTVKSSYQLGQLYLNGRIFDKNYNMALLYFNIAAGHGSADAQIQIAHLYFYGYGVKKNYAKAIELYSKATYKKYTIIINSTGMVKLNDQKDEDTENSSEPVQKYTKESPELKAPQKLYANLLTLPCDADSSFVPTGESRKRYYENHSGKEKLIYEHLSNFESILYSAERGIMESEFLLAELYFQGQGSVQNRVEAFRWYTKSALQGYQKALSKIHELYHKDDKLDRIINSKLYYDPKKEEERNYSVGIKQYFLTELTIRQKSDPENGLSQQILGFLYQHGYCVKKNNLMATEYYKKAAEKGLVGAQLNLGHLYRCREENEYSISAKEANFAEAFNWYKLAAEGFNHVAQNYLADIYLDKFEVRGYLTKALELYEQSAVNGNVRSQVALAKLYRIGKFFPKNLKESIKWYNLAALQGSKIAESSICTLNRFVQENQDDDIENGDFTTGRYSTGNLSSKLRNDVENIFSKENKEELKLLARNALVRDGDSMLRVGLNYCNGIDFPKNEDVGLKWINKAAKTGNHEAQYILGRKYENMAKKEHADTDSLIKDRHFLNASIWYKKAAIQNNYKAQCSLGLLYEYGFGVKKNLELAEHWYTKSVEGNNWDAQYHLGVLIFSRTKPENHLIELANLYGTGNKTETEISMDKAISLIKQSSNHDNPKANYMMGLFHENGVTLPLPKENENIIINQDPQSAKKYYERALRIYKERANSSASCTSILTTIYTDDLFLTNISFKSNVDHETSATTTGERSLDSKCNELKVPNRFSSICFDKSGSYVLEFSYQKPTRKANVYGRYHPEILIFSENRLDIQLKYISSSINFANISPRKDRFRDDYSISRRKIEGTDKYINLPNNTVEVLINQSSESTEKDSEDANPVLQKWSVAKATSAQLALARIYSGGFRLRNVQLQSNIIEKNNIISAEYYKMAADNGNSTAQYELACLRLNKSRTKKHYEECYKLFQKATDMGNIGAKNILDPQAKQVTTVNPDQFVEMLLNNADTGISIVEYQLGYFYEYGSKAIGSTIITQSYPQAIKLYERAAEAGVSYAQYQLGCIYEKGKEVRRDLKRAFEFYNQASKNGHVDSIFKLANTYFNEEGGKKYLNKAFEFYDKSSKNGHTDSAFKLANTHSNEEEMKKKDLNKAFKLYSEAAKSGNIYAKEALDIDIANNSYDRDNFLKKLKMYEAAIDEDHYNSYKLGLVYEDKNCPFYNTKKAVEYYIQAMKSNIVEAYYRLGLIEEEKWKDEKSNTESLESSINYYEEYITQTSAAKADAIYRLSALNLFRSEDKKDYQKSFDLLVSASELGHVKATQMLNLSQNVHISKNTILTNDNFEDYHREIYKMCEEVARQGNDTAQFIMGSLFENNSNIQDNSTAIKWYSMAAKNGNRNAFCRLGELYQEKNIEKSVSCYTKAAEFGCEISLSRLGNILKDKSKPRFKLQMRMDRYQKQALNGNASAQYIIGYYHYVENSAPCRLLEALKWFTRSYLLGNEDADAILKSGFDEKIDESEYEKKKLVLLKKMIEAKPQFAYYEIAKLHHNKTSSLRNFPEAFKNYWKAAKELKNKKAEKYIQLNATDTLLIPQVKEKIREMFIHVAKQYSRNEESKLWISEAQYQLGVYYQQKYKQLSRQTSIQNGYHKMPIYLSSATIYFKKAAEYDHTEAEYEMAMIHLENQEIDKAKFFLEKAKEKKHSKACYQLGKLYFDYERDFNNGVQYLKKSAELGYHPAYNKLGLIFKNGCENLSPDYNQAFEAFQRAAEKGNPESQFNLGLLYQTGQGVEKNEYLALQWYEKSAQMGNKKAGFQAAMMYMKGEGASQNKELALEYLKKYSDNDNTEVIYYLSQLNAKKGVTKISLLQESAKTGNHKAQYDLGLIYMLEDGVTQDYNEAFNYLYEAAKNENTEAQSPLGWLYENGKGTEKNIEAAIDCYEHSNQSENKEIQYRLAILHKSRSPPDYEETFLCLKRAADKGHCDAKYQLGLMYEDEKRINKDYPLVEKLYRESSEQGNTDADYRLGLMYMNGKYVEQNYSKAIQHFVKFEDQRSYRFSYSSDGPDMGLFIEVNSLYAYRLYEESETTENGDSQYKLALIYRSNENGQNNYIISKGLFFQAARKGHRDAGLELGLIYLKERNMAEAIRWIENASRHGNVRAKNILGVIYMNDREAYYDVSKAISSFNDAAILGDMDAQSNLGSIYHYGKNVEIDTEEAIKWFKKSAAQGCVASQFALGLVYKSKTDYARSFNCFKKAAEQDHSDSQYFLGWMYENGFGIEKNMIQAGKWYEKSKIQDSYSCSFFLAELHHCNTNTVFALKWYKKALDTKYISFAERGMGLIHEYGHLSERDYHKAFQFYIKSGEKGNVAAYYDLGRMYYYGKGIEKNIEEAITWFKKAKYGSGNSITKHVIASVNGDSTSDTYGEEMVEYIMESANYIATKAQNYIDLLSSLSTPSL